MATPLSWIAKQDARHRLIISLALSGLTWATLGGRVSDSTRSIATWDAFAFCVLALAWLTIVTTPPAKLRSRARDQDVSRTVIFVFVVLAACAGLFAVGFLFYANKGTPRPHFTFHLLLTLFAVVASWCLVHTVFGLRYAHKFYGDDDDAETDRHAGGLEFPGERLPDYMDFAYFSFVIGMTFQVSDVQITTREFRQLVLIHGMLAFAFNTVILALTINTVSSML
ncbi:MAG: DUF1345 domain-containing protein [Verrucomicrobiota bacterium]|nr:DUF1345 domain-containing protein [Verrucomicrobiota bacterium]